MDTTADLGTKVPRLEGWKVGRFEPGFEPWKLGSFLQIKLPREDLVLLERFQRCKVPKKEPCKVGMIVAFLNQKGGVGKSTISAHFALWHHEKGYKVCLIDADAQETITKWVAKSKADDKLPSIELPVAALTDPDDIVSAVRGVHEIYDIVVLDGPGGIKDTSRACCLAADVVVVPAGPSTVDLESTMDTIRVLKNCQMARESARPFPLLVLNRLRNRRYRLTREALEVKDELGIPACDTGLSTLDAYADAIGKGTAVWHLGKSAQRATDEITELLEEITLYAKQLADGQAQTGRAAVRQRTIVSSGN